MNWKVPYFELVLGLEEKQAVMEVLDSNWLTTGPKISEFETIFANQLGGAQTQAVAVSNCTVALHLALLALEITTGDEVICPSLTFVATANAIRYTGAMPVFADVCSEEEWNIDPADIEAKITERTKAIIVVHYGGYPCRMEEVLEIAKKYNLKVIEDASHAALAEWQGKKLGTVGDIGCFSFFSNKNMTTGEGGMVVTANADLVANIKAMRSHGMTSTSYERFKGHAFAYDVTVLGYNYRMDEIRAAIGIEQLKKLPGGNRQRRQLINYYRQIVASSLPEFTIPFNGWDGEYGYHIFPVLLPKGYMERNRLISKLSDHGIQTSIHYRPVHSFTAYSEFKASLPKTEMIAPRILSLPLYPTLHKDQMDYVVAMIRSCLK